MTETIGAVRLEPQHDGQIVRMTFDTGTPHNVITLAALGDLETGIERVAKLAPRVLILAGRRENFSRGAAIEEIAGMGEPFKGYIAREFDLFSRVEALPFLTVAAMTGIVIGNAAELALACDFRFANDKARFSLPEVAIGFVAPAQRLTRIVGMGVAKDLLFNARMLGAEEALRLGIFTRVVGEAEFDAGLSEFAVELAAKPPISVRRTKEGIAHAYRFAHADYEGEKRAAWETYVSEDGKEGIAAVRARRKPVFKGR